MATRRHTTSPAGVPRRRLRGETGRFPTLEPFARRLESLRLERRLTQQALAGPAGVSTNHYQSIARADANPTLIVLLRLVAALGVSIVDVFEPSSSPPDDYRLVLVDDLRELATSHQRLTALINRLARAERHTAVRRS